MTDRYAKKRAAILSKHWRDAWHLRAAGRLFIRNRQTGAIIDAGHIDPGPHKPPVARPRISSEPDAVRTFGQCFTKKH